MAVKDFQGGNSTFTNTGNWVGGVAPTGSDTINILRSSQSIDAYDGSAGGGNLDPAAVNIGGTYSGSLGTSTGAIVFDDVTRLTVNVDGGPDQVIHLSADPVTTGIIRNTGSNQYACLLNGTWTTLYVFGGQSVTIGASATVTTLFVLPGSDGKPPPNIRILAGAAVTTINASTGVIKDYRTAPGTVNLSGSARYYGVAIAAQTITSLTARGTSAAFLGGAGGTLTAGFTYDDAVITSQAKDTQSGYSWTYTAVTALGGVVSTKDSDVLTAATEAGGSIPFLSAAGTAVFIGAHP